MYYLISLELFKSYHSSSWLSVLENNVHLKIFGLKRMTGSFQN